MNPNQPDDAKQPMEGRKEGLCADGMAPDDPKRLRRPPSHEANAASGRLPERTPKLGGPIGGEEPGDR
jgi:hypothetical protein